MQEKWRHTYVEKHAPNFCDETGNAIKPLNVADYNLHMCCVYKEWPTATVLAVAHGNRQKNVLPPVRSGYSEELCSLIMWWGKKDFFGSP